MTRLTINPPLDTPVTGETIDGQGLTGDKNYLHVATKAEAGQLGNTGFQLVELHAQDRAIIEDIRDQLDTIKKYLEIITSANLTDL